MVLTRFSQFALQLRVQCKRFDWITEQLENDEVVCCVPPFFCVCAYINDYRYAKDEKEYELH